MKQSKHCDKNNKGKEIDSKKRSIETHQSHVHNRFSRMLKDKVMSRPTSFSFNYILKSLKQQRKLLDIFSQYIRDKYFTQGFAN